MAKTTFDLNTINGRIGYTIDNVGAPAAKELLGYSKSMIYRYRKDAEHMSFAHVAVLANYAEINLNWIFSGIGEAKLGAHLGSNSGVKVCFLDSNEEPPIYFSNNFLINDLGIDPASAALVRVDDDAMINTVKLGDIALISNGKSTADGLYAIEINASLKIKRLQHQPTGSVKIISDNPAYDGHTLTAEEFDSIRIAGKVVWHGGQ